MIGDRRTYTVVNHVIEFSVRGGKWLTWPGINADVIAGLDDEDILLNAFRACLRTKHDPETGMRFRMVHRTAVIEDFVMAEEMPDGRVAVPAEHSDPPAVSEP